MDFYENYGEHKAIDYLRSCMYSVELEEHEVVVTVYHNQIANEVRQFYVIYDCDGKLVSPSNKAAISANNGKSDFLRSTFNKVFGECLFETLKTR